MNLRLQVGIPLGQGAENLLPLDPGGIDRLRDSGLDANDAQQIYRHMLMARAISEKSWLLTRQGRVLFSMPCDGQEAADVASAYALDVKTDFVVPYARSLGAMLVKGMLTPRPRVAGLVPGLFQ